MNSDSNRSRFIKKTVRELGLIGVSILIVVGLFRGVQLYAGTLIPLAPPTTGTLNSAEDVYAPLASTTYDSSGVTASSTGNALQITKCIITKMTGGSCP
jgi:hypothetical protein